MAALDLPTVIALLQDEDEESDEIIQMISNLTETVVAASEVYYSQAMNLTITTEALLHSPDSAFNHFYLNATPDGFQKYFRFDRSTFGDIAARVRSVYVHKHYMCAYTSSFSPYLCIYLYLFYFI